MSSKNRTIKRHGIIRLCKNNDIFEARSMKHVLLLTAIALLLIMHPLVVTPHLTSVALAPASPHSVPLETSAGNPNVSLTFTSLWNSTPTVVHAGDRISGDHIVLHSRWVPNTTISMSIISVNATVVPKAISAQNNSAEVSIDTRLLGNNFTCQINMTAILANGSVITSLLENVFLGNFFTPTVQVITPNGGEVWHGLNNITWVASDKNSDETLTYDVFVSSDGGLTLMLLTSDLNRTWYLWNCSPFTRSSTYIIAVRVSDGIYSSMDMSDDVFTAGDIVTTTTTTSTTTTSSTTATTTTTALPTLRLEGPIVTFLLASLISSVAMALFVYYSAKRWV
ncbi:MAG: hypothetical protein K9W43_09170 [Candidatus Thorarchaeota archaeon]|nr:hypothetical protein [Candidatus Thorarchaeota archaeon]